MVNISGEIAVVFDFDDTLAPDSTSWLLQKFDVDPTVFWRQAGALLGQGYDQAHAYLRLLLEMIGDGRPLGPLTNDQLGGMGRALDELFYPGLPGLLDDLRGIVSQNRGVSIDFYIVSGGLEGLIRGSQIVSKYFRGVYGCLLGGDEEGDVLRNIRRAVTFTEKTRFLFEINKGLDDSDTLNNPFLVNKQVDPEVRAVPWQNMFYVGDGLTDIPCFSLVEYMGGKAFGVLHTDKAKSGKTRLAEMLGPRRARSMNAPKYREDDDLGAILRAMVASACVEIGYRRNTRA